MNIRATSFDPLKYEVDGMESPITELTYKDENDVTRTLSYLVINGEKVAIKHEAELFEKLADSKLDDALVKVEEDRVKKIEDEKNKSTTIDPIKP